MFIHNECTIYKGESMVWIILGLAFGIGSLVAIQFVTDWGKGALIAIPTALIVIFCLIFPSFVIIGQDSVGHLKRIYGDNLPAGRIIAMDGEKGPQAETLGPGFHFHFMVSVFYNVEELDVVDIPDNHYAIITAKDGKPLRDGQFLADAWGEENYANYLNAEYFMEADESGEPRGQKGPQLTVLRPGKYRLNRYLFDISEPKTATEIGAGFVGVIKSNVGKVYGPGDELFDSDKGGPIIPQSIVDAYTQALQIQKTYGDDYLSQQIDRIRQSADHDKAGQEPTEDKTTSSEGEVGIVAEKPTETADAPRELIPATDELRQQARKMALKSLSTPLVPKGYIGVQNRVLTPGKYYLNNMAYTVEMMDTRIQTWRYEGGYTRRNIDLAVDANGSVTQKESAQEVIVPEGAADEAIHLKVEGWQIPQDCRVLVQVTPDNAPFVVAYVGNLDLIEDRIITPALRSVMRSVLGHERVRALDLLYQRTHLEKLTETFIIPEGLKSGLEIRELRFGDPAVPPELLIPGKRRQLASQMREVFAQEELAQQARVERENKAAEANQQETLVKASMERKAAEQQKERDRLLGEGQRAKLEEIAAGQQKQVEVLGKDKTYELAVLDKILAAAVSNPEIVKVSTVSVQGGSNSLTGAAAVLGNSQLTNGLSNLLRPSN